MVKIQKMLCTRCRAENLCSSNTCDSCRVYFSPKNVESVFDISTLSEIETLTAKSVIEISTQEDLLFDFIPTKVLKHPLQEKLIIFSL